MLVPEKTIVQSNPSRMHIAKDTTKRQGDLIHFSIGWPGPYGVTLTYSELCMDYEYN